MAEAWPKGSASGDSFTCILLSRKDARSGESEERLWLRSGLMGLSLHGDSLTWILWSRKDVRSVGSEEQLMLKSVIKGLSLDIPLPASSGHSVSRI